MGSGASTQTGITLDEAKASVPEDLWDQGRWEDAVSEDGTVPADVWNKAVESYSNDTPETRLRIVHINDVYKLDPFPRLKTLIDEQRAAHKNCLVVLPGDFLGPSLLSSLDQGAGMVCCMNRVGVDIVCFGNHENDVDIKSLQKAVKNFKGTWLNSNMDAFTPSLPRKKIVELQGEDGSPCARKVGFLGFLIGGKGFENTYRANSFGGASDSISSILECHEAEADAIASEVDAIIPLTHQDVAEDRKMAESGRYPVIIGGHDHDVVNEKIAGVPVVKAGMDAAHAALIDVVWAKGAASPSVSVEIVDVANYEPNEAIATIVEKKLAPVRALSKATLLQLTPQIMERFAGKLSTLSSKRTRFEESTFATMLATLGAECMDVDFCAINAGAIRGDMDYPEGSDVSFAHLKKECPFPSSVVICTVTGAVLAEAVESSRAGWYENAEPIESSQALHGDNGAKVQVAEDGKSCKLVTVGGEPLQREKEYSVLLDTYDIKKNTALAAYKMEHPEHFPPADSGRPVLPILVERLAKMLFLTIVDANSDGDGGAEEIDALFAKFDSDGTNGLSADEIAKALASKLGDGASNLVASTMLSLADVDGNGNVSKDELRKVVESVF